MKKIKEIIKRKWMKLRLQPIRVFCFHQVSAVFDPSTMWECDWTEINQFKKNILKLKETYEFISLPEAHHLLSIASSPFSFRQKKYAVLTSDDGWASLKEILPWIYEQRIPITLFLNPCYLDEGTYQERKTERLLRSNDVDEILRKYPNVSFGSHGWTHTSALKQSDLEFEQSVQMSVSRLQRLNNYVPFFAFTYGANRDSVIQILHKMKLTPVKINGNQNFRMLNEDCLDRELIDGIDKINLFNKI